MRTTTVVDIAGSFTGGAGTFRQELLKYIAEQDREDVLVIGDNNYLTSKWLVAREVIASKHKTKIALNNAGFLSPGGERTVLLRNVIHWSSQEEFDRLGFIPTQRMKKQIPVIRALANRSSAILVPSIGMAERVKRINPRLESRIAVLPNPLSPFSAPGQPSTTVPTVLVPMVPQPYKKLDDSLRQFEAAIRLVSQNIQVLVTATPDEIPGFEDSPFVHLIGRIGRKELEAHLATSRAIFFPSVFESFGYPVAEARTAGRWVIAPDIPQYREMAGPAHAPYTIGDEESLAAALLRSLTPCPDPDPAPFDPHSYFTKLLAPRS